MRWAALCLSYEPPGPGTDGGVRCGSCMTSIGPGLTEEIQGVADSLVLPFEKGAILC